MNVLSIIIVLLILFICWQVYNKIYSFLNNKFTKQLQLQQLQQQSIKSIEPIKSIKSHQNKSILKKSKNISHNKRNKHNKKVKFASDNLVFLDVGTDSKYYGKIIIKLFDDIVPKTCHNFRELCKSKKYFNSPFHRIIKDFMIQGGDYTKHNGTGGISIYGSKFPDENFKIQHDRPYLLSMANSGPNTNGSQFFITTGSQPHLDGKHVVFGEVKSGTDVVDVLNNVNTTQNDKPIENIKILNCGVFSDLKQTKK